ncbi:MAG TPA: hypothetical protein VKG25_07275 [Bryobacteraceae bacterium]|nr:hypothetical protein [Bryobacteraceae bacterium]
MDKRFAHRYQFTGSYAYQDSKSINDIGLNLNNYFASYGPDQPKHVLNISGIVDLKWGIQFSLLSALTSPQPVEPYIAGADPTGTNFGRTDGPASGPYAPLPGEQYNGWLTQSGLRNLVTSYNSKIAGTKDPYGNVYPAIALPSHFNLGHDFTSQDIRLTKSFKIREKYEFRIIAEGFNIFNFGNLTGDNFNLLNPAFGQPTQRVSSTFGSGGPRAFQFAGRFQF